MDLVDSIIKPKIKTEEFHLLCRLKRGSFRDKGIDIFNIKFLIFQFEILFEIINYLGSFLFKRVFRALIIEITCKIILK